MDLTHYVDDLQDRLAAAAEIGGDDARQLAQRLTAPLDAAVRLVLLDALTAAAGEISAELAPSFATVAVVVSAAVTALAATALASAALLAISRIEAPISSAPAATVATLRDTSSAAPATTPDWVAVSAADEEICADEALSSSDDDATAAAEGRTRADAERLVWRTTGGLFPDDYPETYGFDLFGRRVGVGAGGTFGE